MEDDFINCPHCDTLNFSHRKSCSLCKFLLPHPEEFVAPASTRLYRFVYLLAMVCFCSLLFLLFRHGDNTRELPVNNIKSTGKIHSLDILPTAK